MYVLVEEITVEVEFTDQEYELNLKFNSYPEMMRHIQENTDDKFVEAYEVTEIIPGQRLKTDSRAYLKTIREAAIAKLTAEEVKVLGL